MKRTYSVALEVLFLDDRGAEVFQRQVAVASSGMAFKGTMEEVLTKYFKDNIDDVNILQTKALFRISSEAVDVPWNKALLFSRFCVNLRRICGAFKSPFWKITFEVVEVEQRNSVIKDN